MQNKQKTDITRLLDVASGKIKGRRCGTTYLACHDVCGTVEVDVLRAVAIQANGSIVLAGSTLGDWSGLNAGSDDFAALALDSEGQEIWRWQVIPLEPYNRGARMD